MKTTNTTRPRAGHGLGSAIDTSRGGPVITKSAKPDRNRNRVTSAKPTPVARREKRK